MKGLLYWHTREKTEGMMDVFSLRQFDSGIPYSAAMIVGSAITPIVPLR